MNYIPFDDYIVILKHRCDTMMSMYEATGTFPPNVLEVAE